MKNIKVFGNLLNITLDNGLNVMAYPTGNDLWLVKSDPNVSNDSVTTTIQKLGNQLDIKSSDGSSAIAYPTNGEIWLVNGTATTGGSPGSGGTGLVNDWEWPMDTSKWMISSPYGPRSTPYVGFHYGIDITGSGVTGIPVWAVSAGVMETNSYNSRAGYFCIILHPDGTRTQYMHFPTYGPVAAGASVIKGQQIGNVGASGDSTGAHLHFQTQDTSNTAVDPILYMRARGHEFGEVQPT